MSKRQFGNVRQLSSGNWQARYTDRGGRIRKAPVTYQAKIDAEGWLLQQYKAIREGTWIEPPVETYVSPEPAEPRSMDHALTENTLGGYAEGWLADRVLSPSTRRLYRSCLDNQILKSLGTSRLTDITPPMVRSWHARLDTGPRQKAQAYSLLRTILRSAVDDDLIPASPCRIRGAGTSRRARTIRPASLPELEQIAGGMPEAYRLMVLLAAWCALRFGELAELRVGDIDVEHGLIRVRRGMVRGDTGKVVKGPKSHAGKRDVNIPPHLWPAVKDHLNALNHMASASTCGGPANEYLSGTGTYSPRALLFPGERGGHLSPTSLYSMFYPARDKAGRPDLRFHDLRHTGAVLAAATGATLAELMNRLGHSTVSAALQYQHASQDRDKVIAEALSKLAEVVPITAAKGKRTAG